MMSLSEKNNNWYKFKRFSATLLLFTTTQIGLIPFSDQIFFNKSVLAGDPSSSGFRDPEYTAKYSKEPPSSNEKFIQLSNQRPSPCKVFFQAENIVLKELNDSVFKDKPTVDGIINSFKAHLKRAAQADTTLSHAILADYSSYKSVGICVQEDSQAIRDKIQKVYNQANQEFIEELQKSPLHGAITDKAGYTKDPSKWHLGAFGKTPDEAEITSRAMRALIQNEKAGSSAKIRAYDESEIQRYLNNKLKELWALENESKRILNRVPQGLTSLNPSRPKDLVPNEDLLEAFKKVDAKDANEYQQIVQNRIKKRFGVSLSTNEINQIKKYADAVDLFSLSPQQTERIHIPYGVAEHHMVSTDFAGQGTANQRYLMANLSQDHISNIPDAVSASRGSFNEATEDMISLQKELDDAVGHLGKAYFSGDDGIIMTEKPLTDAQKQEITRRLSHSNRPHRFRLTFVPMRYGDTGEIIPESKRSGLIIEAESYQKNLKKEILKGLDPRSAEELKDQILAIDYVPMSNPNKPGVFKVVTSAKANTPIFRAIENATQTMASSSQSVFKVEPPLSSYADNVIPFPKKGIPTPEDCANQLRTGLFILQKKAAGGRR